MSARIRDVAEHAGVSTATVSRVLSGVDPVSKDLTARVWAAVNELGYRPNRVARRLRRPGHETWALIVPDVENRFFTSIARGVEEVASEAGISVFIGNTDGDPERLQRYVDTAIAEQVAGVILAPATPADDVSDLIRAGVPVVTVDQPLDDSAVVTVMTDHFEGGRLAGEVLLGAGCVAVGVIAGPVNEPSWNTRLKGLADRLGDALIVAVERGDNRVESGRQAVARILDRGDSVDGLFITNNLMTIGALRELAARDISVPDDLQVVGYDLKSEEWVTEVPVASINQSPPDLGRTVGHQLLTRTGGARDEAEVILMKPTLRTMAGQANAT